MTTIRLYHAIKEHADITAVVNAATKSSWGPDRPLPLGGELQTRLSRATKELYKAMDEAKAIIEAEDEHSRNVAKRIAGERDVCRHLITSLLNQGLKLKVEEVCGWLTDPDALIENAMAMDVVSIYARDKETEKSVGWVLLVYGNSPEELIADYTVPFEVYLKPTEDYVQKFYE